MRVVIVMASEMQRRAGEVGCGVKKSDGSHNWTYTPTEPSPRKRGTRFQVDYLVPESGLSTTGQLAPCSSSHQCSYRDYNDRHRECTRNIQDRQHSCPAPSEAYPDKRKTETEKPEISKTPTSKGRQAVLYTANQKKKN